MENNIDTQLELAVSTSGSYDSSEEELYIGYNRTSNTWTLLIRYYDNISDLAERYLIRIFYLLSDYAIIEIPENNIAAFAADPRILYVEKPKSVQQQVSYAQYASCLSGTFINNYGLDGNGTLLAVIDSGIDYRHEEFIRDGKSRIFLNCGTSRWHIRLILKIYFGLGRIYSNEELNEILDGTYTGVVPSEDTTGHGTQVTAIAAGTNIGVAPQTDILVIKIGSDTTSGIPTTLGIILELTMPYESRWNCRNHYLLISAMEIIMARIKAILCWKIILMMCPDLPCVQFPPEPEMMQSTEDISGWCLEIRLTGWWIFWSATM